MSIYGGFEALVYESTGASGAASNIGVSARVNPLIDPGNIDVAGTGRRGLYDILLGIRDPQFALDLLPTDYSFIKDYQNGQTAIPYLHYRIPSAAAGLTFTNVYVNRLSIESRNGEAVEASLELWAENCEALYTMTWGSVVTTPYRWLDTQLDINSVTETQWWSWRYEVLNNLQRLGDVDSGGTRECVARNRRVNGLIVKDMRSVTEFTDLMNILSETAKFPITIYLGGTTAAYKILDSNCRWGRLEAPSGPEDLIAKRFPFTALDLT